MCGIAAYVGTEEFSPVHLKLLALYQDSRGGDGAGIGYYSDGIPIILKGAPHPEYCIVFKDLKELYSNLYEYPDTGTLFELLGYYINIEEIYSKTIILHSRKTTIGNNTLENTHPFNIVGERDIIGCHNGTVLNYRELGKTLRLPKQSATNDSKVLLNAIALNKLDDIYPEIDGAANLVWVDKSEPDVIYFIGTDNNTKNKLDRTLYYLTHPGRGTYISSEYMPLSYLRGLFISPNTRIKEIPQSFSPNILYRIEGNKIDEIKKYAPKKVAPKIHVVHKSDFTSRTLRAVEVLRGEEHPQYRNMLYYHNGVYKINGERITTEVRFTREGKPEIEGKYLYTAEGRPLNQDLQGYVHYRKSATEVEYYNGPVYELYMIKGIVFHNRESFLKFIKVYPGYTTTPPSAFIGYSRYPVPASLNSKEIISGFFHCSPDLVAKRFRVTPIFSTKIMEFNKGFVHSITDISRNSAKRLWKTDKKHFAYEAPERENWLYIKG